MIPTEETVVKVIPTTLKVKCRQEPTFEAVVRFDDRGRAYIECPNCGRVYYFQSDGTWFADRNLTFLFKE